MFLILLNQQMVWFMLNLMITNFILNILCIIENIIYLNILIHIHVILIITIVLINDTNIL